MNVAPEAVIMRIMAEGVTETHESLVDQVALSLFPHSNHIMEIGGDLFKGKRQGSVMEATDWVRGRVA